MPLFFKRMPSQPPMPLSLLAELPKAELHVHLEGTMPPLLVRKMATEYGIELSPELFTDEGTYQWKDFPDFLN